MKIAFTLVMLITASTSILPAAELKGQVTFQGKVPAPQLIQINKDTRICGLKKEINRLMLDAKGGVSGALVRIVGVRSDAPYSGPEPVLNQKNCDFVPPVVAVPVGGTLIITSEDPVLHNVHALREDGSTVFNYAVPIKGMKLRWKAAAPGILKVKCDAGHTWMQAWIVVTENPYFAITGPNGTFTISGVPPGDYQAEAWHPALGRQTQMVKVAASGGTVSFKFAGK